jgi:hypothetical protein
VAVVAICGITCRAYLEKAYPQMKPATKAELACMDNRMHAILMDEDGNRVGMIEIEKSMCGEKPKDL